jgi:hypothetical protein
MKALPLQRIGRILGWFIGSALLVSMLYLGIIQGMEGAVRVASFLIWMTFVFSLFMLSNEFVQVINKMGRPPMPRWVDVAFDLTLVMFLLWHGWVFSGVAYFIHIMLFQRRYEDLASMADVFNEWARQYAENPEAFTNCLDADGKPLTDYGARCEVFFQQVLKGLNERGGLVPKHFPQPSPASAAQ